MKIIYLTQYAVDGQFQSQFYNYSKYLRGENEVKVEYLFKYEENNTLIEAYRNNKVEVNSLNFNGNRISLKNLLKYIKWLSKETNVVIVHSQHPIAGFYNKIGTTLVNLFYGKQIKIIVEQRCVKKNLSTLAQVLETITHPFADAIICSSDSVERSYFKNVNSYLSFLKERKIKHFTFYNSIDIIDYDSFSKSNFIQEEQNDQFKLCIVGRLEPVKQPLEIIKAIQILKDQNIILYIAGTGSLEPMLKSFVSQHHLHNKVIFLGNIDWVNDLLYETDVFLNYSKHEGLSKALLEAMAMGKPVIASRVEGNLEVLGVRNEFGILVDATTPESLAEAILYLKNDKKSFQTYSSQGRIRVQQFDVKKQVVELEKIYQKLIYGT